MNTRHVIVQGCALLVIALFLFNSGCTKKDDVATSGGSVKAGAPGANQSPQLVAQGKELFTNYCIHCHGPSGVGDGFNARNVDPAPRDLTDRDTEEGEIGFMAALTNEKIYNEVIGREFLNLEDFEALQEAYFDAMMMDDEAEAAAAEAKLPLLVPPAMPTFRYTLSDAERWALVAYLRTLHKNDAPPVEVSAAIDTSRPAFPAREAPDLNVNGDERTALAELGKSLFIDKFNCNGCHVYKEGEMGGAVGPDLTRSGDRLNPNWTYQWISNPQAVKPDTKMPNFALTEEEAKAVTLYLGTLQPEAI